MADAADDRALDRAKAAAGAGDWKRAYALLAEAKSHRQLSPAEQGVLAETAYAAGHLDVAIETWERIYRDTLNAGDRVAAAGAAVKVALHLLLDTALMAPVRGWVRRSEALLTGYEETPIHAWLAVVRSYERLLSGDVKSASVFADDAIRFGASHDSAALAIGRVAKARTVILDGRFAEGLALLEEAGASATSGELDPLCTGIVYCVCETECSCSPFSSHQPRHARLRAQAVPSLRPN
jgi:ATP/maltotriose-dependent transcriptional regulator MalT